MSMRRRRRDDEALAHRRRRQRQWRMAILSDVALSPIGPQGIIGPTGQRVFPETEGLPAVLGRFIGELVHTYNATWEWTGFVWRQKFFP